MAGQPYLDAIAAIGVSLMIGKIGWTLGWGAIRELVDTGVDPDALQNIIDTIESVDGVREFHMLRTRRMGGEVLVEVHILVNNAGVTVYASFEEHNIEDLEWILGVNIWGVIYGCKTFLPGMLEQGEGHIINTASYVAFAVLKGQTVYSATKHAVRAFHHGVAQEHENDPIDFTRICPTAVDTRMLRQQVGQDSCALAFSEASVTPEQVADAIHRAAKEKPLEILVPRWPGAALRFIGVMPRLLRAITHRAEKKGLEVVAKQRQRTGQ